MRQILIILSLLLFSFTVITCSKNDDSSRSSSDIKLSDVKANLSGKSLFITTGDSSSSSSRSSRSSNKTSSTSTDSLITIDNNSLIDYGIISDYDLEIEQVRANPKNEYAYVLMKYGGNANSDSVNNVLALNCTIFKVNLSTNEMNCVEPGLVVTGTKQNMISAVNDYHLDLFQFGTENTFVFRTVWTDQFTAKSDLSCSQSCIYEHNTQTGVTRRVSPYSYEGERFVALGDGNIIWSGMETFGNNTGGHYPNQILLIDKQGKITELTSDPDGVFAGDFQGGDYRTAFWGSETYKAIVFARVLDGVVRRTFVERERDNAIVIKGDDGNIYAQREEGLYSILPNKIDPLVSIPELWKNKKETTDCGGYSSTCGIHFTIVNGIVFYNNYAVTLILNLMN